MEVASPSAAIQASSSLLAILASSSDPCDGTVVVGGRMIRHCARIVRGAYHCRFFGTWIAVLDDSDFDSRRMVIDAGGLGV